MRILSKKKILGTDISAERSNDILEYVFEKLENSDEKFYIVTPNPEILVYAIKHASYQKILNQARFAIPDGIGVLLAGLLLSRSLPQRITGVDLLENLCKESVKQSKNNVKKAVTVGFLGAKSGVAEGVRNCLVKKYPGLQVSFANSEWDTPRENDYNTDDSGNTRVENGDREKSGNGNMTNSEWQIANRKGEEKDEQTIIHSPLSNRQVDILFVAFGFPKQEEWISENLKHLPVRVAMGVGGAFDYIAGEVPRAPTVVRAVGLEWLYRLIRQPWRWKRQLALIEFGLLVFKELLTGKPLEK